MSHTPNNPCDWNGHLTDWWFTRGGVCDQYLCLPSLFQKLPANKYWSRYITFFVLFFGVLNLSSKNWAQIDIDLTALLFRSDMFVYFLCSVHRERAVGTSDVSRYLLLVDTKYTVEYLIYRLNYHVIHQIRARWIVIVRVITLNQNDAW